MWLLSFQSNPEVSWKGFVKWDILRLTTGYSKTIFEQKPVLWALYGFTFTVKLDWKKHQIPSKQVFAQESVNSPTFVTKITAFY